MLFFFHSNMRSINTYQYDQFVTMEKYFHVIEFLKID